MTKIRVLLTFITLIVVGIAATLIGLYARGYRFNIRETEIVENGLLVIKSEPDGAEIFINGKLNTATNATITLPPNVYDVEVKKEGYLTWSKRLTIEKEVITQVTAQLFKSAPSLSALTFTPVTRPTPSYDSTKIAYIIPPDGNGDEDRGGLWIIEMVNLPLGFAREPRMITDGNLTEASFEWSPDGKEILLTTSSGLFLLNSSEFKSQRNLVNALSNEEEIRLNWQEDYQKRLNSQLSRLPDELETIMNKNTKEITFSPDGDMILYTASGSAQIKKDLITKVPGASTQKQDRELKDNHTYIYDIKEDRNFLIDSDSSNLSITNRLGDGITRRLSFFPTSRNLVLAEDGKVIVLDYDGTNRQVVYSGNYVSPYAFATLSVDRLIILTNLGSDQAPNLYSLGIK